MAHALKGHDGPCRYIHGHSYKLSVTIIGMPIPDNTSPRLGMVMDFGDLKKIVHENVIRVFDHALVLNRNSLMEAQDTIPELFEKMLMVDYQPTSENLLLDFLDRIRPSLPQHARLHSMKLRETATAYAEWFAEENDKGILL